MIICSAVRKDTEKQSDLQVNFLESKSIVCKTGTNKERSVETARRYHSAEKFSFNFLDVRIIIVAINWG